MKHTYTTLYLLTILLILPLCGHAADVSFAVSPSVAPADGAMIIEVDIDDSGESLNALQGMIGFQGEGKESITDVIVETGDSVFTLWPQVPTYDARERVIRFTGGTPVSPFGEGHIFRLRVFASSTKTITLSWLGGVAYRNDGLGTPVGISSRSITFTPNVGVPNIIQTSSEDTKPPRIESVEISQDESLFNGAYFLSVHATDDISGVSYYEVEEEGIRTRLTNTPYEIKNQSLDQPLLVIVYDGAGNSVSIKVPQETALWKLYLLVVCVGVCVIVFVLKRYRNRYHR